MSTKLIRSLYNLHPSHQGGVITLGHFDGVHVGHQQLIAKVIEEAKKKGVPSIVGTFEPHAFEFFSKHQVTIPRLTRLREKFLALARCGVDYVLVLPFNQYLANLSASDFVTKIVHQQLRAKQVIIGDDFHFGYQRQGDFALLQSMGRDLNFSVEAMPSIIVKNERVSSTRIRKALVEGDLQLAELLLGHPYTLQGCVRRGDQLGRQWGFPTINIFLNRKLTPVNGVFAVRVYGADGSKEGWPGAANVGVRPTVDGTRTLLEVHLLDFNQNLYGRYVDVAFCKKFRDEVHYATVDLLKEQIAKDVVDTRDYFKKVL